MPDQMGLLKGKRGLVIGAGSDGIGKAVARLAISHDAAVSFTYHRRTEHVEDLISWGRDCGIEVKAYAAELKEEGAAAEIVRRVWEDYCSLDFLVYSAGIVRRRSLGEMKAENLQEHVKVNVLPAVEALLTMAKCSQDAGHAGSAVYIGSPSAETPVPGLSAYSASKAAGHAFMLSAAMELGPVGFRVNSVLPGTTVTDLNRELLHRPDIATARSETIPLGRLATPEDIAGPVVFLCSDMAAYITGATLTVDGGQSRSVHFRSRQES